MEYRPLLLEEAEKIREIDAGCHIHNTWWFHSETGTYELKEINWTDHGLPNGLEWHIEHFRHSVADGGDAFGCFDDGKLVAYGTTGSEVFGRMAKYILLDQLFVSKDYRNKHIGRTLLRMCAERARNRGAEKLYLCAGSSEDTVAFYRKMGCVPAMEVQRELFEEAPNDIQLEYDDFRGSVPR